MKILILCTGNTCRSQMAEGFLKNLDQNLEVYSAGTEPGEKVHPKAIQVMKEKGIEIGNTAPKSVNEFISTPFDYVITVCDGAREKCPVFLGTVTHRLHIGFDDPADATGTEEEILEVFRRVRDEIFRDFMKFYFEHVK
ncbi:MAG: arsenate reductase ArsC [Bacteroidales bacterium]|nr:arsenate reductase ArsC [Bacteroidales bacterium]